MRQSIDARGLACPQPVILCRRAIAEGRAQEIEIVVDNEPARENVLRFLQFAGAREPVVASAGTVHTITSPVTAAMIEKARGSAPAPACTDEPASPEGRELSDKTLFFSSDQVGRGDETLGRLLVRGLLFTLTEMARPPKRLVFMNAGVRLAAEREDTIDLLKTIEARGVELLVCGTCLDYYHLVERLRAGRISNMYEIAEALAAPGGVVTVS